MLNYVITDMLDKLLENLDNKKKLELSLISYTEKLYNKLKRTKNIIFRDEPVDFYDNYIPLTLVGSNNNIRVTKPQRLFEEYKKIGIIGTAGSGKTTLLRYLALTLIEEDKNKIPVFVELRNYDSSKYTFENYVAAQISESQVEAVKKIFKSKLFVFIFDGYDEIDYVQGSSFINQLDKFIADFSGNSFVISSRPGTNIESVSPLYIFHINPLNEDDIYLFIDKINIPSDLRRHIFKSIRNDYSLNDILSIPLFLAFYIATFNPNEPINNKSIFFRNIVDLLFSQHDSISKLGYLREKVSNLDKDTIERIASLLAFRMFFSAKHQFTKDELYNEFEKIRKILGVSFENDKLLFDFTITTNILVQTEHYFSFPHILIMEFLSAIFICRISQESKKDFYEKIADNHSVFQSVSFYNFLYELDKNDFSKYYLLPYLKSFLDNRYYWKDDKKNEILTDFIRIRFFHQNTNIDPFNSNSISDLYNKLEKETSNNELLDSLFDVM